MHCSLLLYHLHLELTHPDLHPHFVNLMTAFRAGSFRHFIGLYTVPCTSHPFLSIGGSTGKLDVYDLSRKAMLFTRIKWGRMVPRVGGRLSPFKFLDLNISHRNSGRLRGADLQ